MTPHDHELQQEQQVLQHFRQHSQGEPSAALDALILDAAREALAQPAPQPSRGQRLHAWLFGAGSRTRWSVAFASLATLGIGLSLTWRTQEQLPTAYDLPAPVAAQAPAAPVLREMAPTLEARKQLAEPEKKKAEMAEFDAVDGNAGYAAPAPAPAMSTVRQAAMAKPQSAPARAMADAVPAPVDTGVARKEAQAKAQPDADSSAALNGQLSEDQLAETLGHSDVDEAPPLELQLHNVLRMRQAGQHADADRLLAMLKREHPQLDLDAELKRLQGETEKPASSP